VFEVNGVMLLLGLIATPSVHTALPTVLLTQINNLFVVVFSHTDVGAYPAFASSVVVGFDVAVVLLRPPVPPFAGRRYPDTEVARLILGEFPAEPS
jgi:hypothetical protein